ncbi:Sodium/glucose cotransporter [Diplonema papillatum]|nr:Sodium/glucose cotransporter [Diplonema papillatum]
METQYVPMTGAYDGFVRFTTWDYIETVVIFVAIIAIAVRASLTQHTTNDNYFLAGKRAPWWMVGCSLFSYGTGVEYIAGMASVGVTHGVSGAILMWGSAPPLLLLGFVMLKLYRRSDIVTLPTFLFQTFGTHVRWIYSGFTLALAMVKIAVALHYGGLLLEVTLDISSDAIKPALLCASALYAVFGGLLAIQRTEIAQTAVLLAITTVLAAEVVTAIGGPSQFTPNLPEGHTRLFRSSRNDLYPWPGVVFGLPVEALVYWCCNQVVTQKALSAKSDLDAKAGCIFCGFLNFLPPFLFTFVGMAIRVLNTPVALDDPSTAYFIAIKQYAPQHTHGIMISILLCSLMTSVASVLFACTAIINLEVVEPTELFSYGRYTQKKKLWASRVSACAVGGCGLALSYSIPLFSSDPWVIVLASSTWSAGILAAFVASAGYGSVLDIRPLPVAVMLAASFVVGLVKVILAEVSSQRSLPAGIDWFATANDLVMTAVLFVLYLAAVVIGSKILVECLPMAVLSGDSGSEGSQPNTSSPCDPATNMSHRLCEVSETTPFGSLDPSFAPIDDEDTISALNETYPSRRAQLLTYGVNFFAIALVVCFAIAINVWW